MFKNTACILNFGRIDIWIDIPAILYLQYLWFGPLTYMMVIRSVHGSGGFQQQQRRIADKVDLYVRI